MDKCVCTVLRDLCHYIGQTVTIFTASGGLSGGGFTGVLISVDDKFISLLVSVGMPPACPLGSACGSNEGFSLAEYGNPVGTICDIPRNAIVGFTHHAF
ncbi:MAG: hypothetical protein LBQ68_10745 [Clostridiales bacterium]|jgi:hypothetical protein|nr:hypothetical protein [Clostridiales bacterium]